MKRILLAVLLTVLLVMTASAAWKRNPDTGIRDYYEPAATDANITTTDVTTNNVSTAKHGFCPKAPNDTTKYLRGDASWAVPSNTGYTLTGNGATFSPGDGEVLYFGSAFDTAPTTSATYRKVYIPKAGTIKVAYITWIAGTAGTGENVTISIRLNNTTDTAIATVGNTADNKLFSNTGLSIAVAQGDYIEFKIACPTWATNPLNVKVTGSIYVE